MFNISASLNTTFSNCNMQGPITKTHSFESIIELDKDKDKDKDKTLKVKK